MSYVNADEVLPEDLIREIQKYVDGKVLYIPRRSEKAMGWGEKNGAKNRLAKRNKEIVSRVRKKHRWNCGSMQDRN